MSARKPRRRGAVLVAALIAAVTGVGLLVPAVSASSAPNQTDPATIAGQGNDIYIADNDHDDGTEPSTGELFASPDIIPCRTSRFCGSDEELSAGAPAWIFVRLNVREPRGSLPSTGTLKLYSTPSGTTAGWPADWTPIGEVSLSIIGSGTIVGLRWDHVPTDNRHYCLLARWESDTDPIPAEGSSTWVNTQNSNNIAWHNVRIFSLHIDEELTWPIEIGDDGPEPIISDLVVSQLGAPFTQSGKLLVDLGPEVAARWKAGGQRGIGIVPAGPTQVQIVNPQQARIQGLAFKPGERIPVGLRFRAGQAAAGKSFDLKVTQTNSKGEQTGGVDYRFKVA